jgi:hypothetical protein
MRGEENCHTCRYSDWGYKYKPEELNPCKICIGFHKWAKRYPGNPNVAEPIIGIGGKSNAKKK